MPGPAVVPRPQDRALDGVRKRYSRRGAWVLNGVDLSLAPGSVTVVVGGNGAGKSTLLKIVAGLLDPTTGRAVGPSRPAATGYAPDRLGARVRMSARVYVEHMARLRHCDPIEAREWAGDLFLRLGLQPGPDAPIRSLSKGNSQKVALTQALVGPVERLILDEPFGGLDPVARDAVSEIVGERTARGTAVLISAHSPLDTIAATHTLRLDRGTLTPYAPAPGSTGPGSRPAGSVRLALTAPHAGALVDGIRGRPFVLDVHHDQRHDEHVATLLVESAGVDDVLGFALAAGWSVISVTRLPT